jgi:integrase/recombinase XerD
MKATVSLILDTRRSLKNESYPVKLRIYYNGLERMVKTGHSMTKDDYIKMNSDKPGKLKDKKFELLDLHVKAETIIKNMHFFDFEQFKNEFIGKKSSIKTLVDLWNEIISNLDDNGRIGTAGSYKCALESVKKFKDPSWSNLNKSYLEQYEKWMLKEGKSLTTIGMYCRALRAVFNEGIERGLITIDSYPFGKKKYKIPKGRGTKKALLKSEIKKIFEFNGSETENKYKDFFILSYLTNGANIKDIANWKYKDIHDNKIVFIRQKTERTTKQDPKPITIILTKPILDIISRIGNKPGPNNYIFPIYKNGMTESEKFYTSKNVVKYINKYMLQIFKKLEIDKHITFYAARHSFATILKQSGASTKFIQDALGHTNESTTENYLASFDDETLKGFAEMLTDF